MPRIYHRHGFGVQSPHDYELVRDVLFEKLSYYAYNEHNLKSRLDKLKYRLQLRYGNKLVCVNENAGKVYESILQTDDDSKVLLVEKISGRNHYLWKQILRDERARVTFDMGAYGLVILDRKRIKQNYLL